MLNCWRYEKIFIICSNFKYHYYLLFLLEDIYKYLWTNIYQSYKYIVHHLRRFSIIICENICTVFLTGYLYRQKYICTLNLINENRCELGFLWLVWYKARHRFGKKLLWIKWYFALNSWIKIFFSILFPTDTFILLIVIKKCANLLEHCSNLVKRDILRTEFP